MAERNPAEPDQFEEFMRRSRNPSGTSIGCIRCACGAEKGKVRWARVANGQPKGTRCFDCWNSNKWRREVGYTNRARVSLETKKQSFTKIRGLLKSLRSTMSSTDPEFRMQRIKDIDGIFAEIGGLDQLPTWGTESTATTSTESFDDLANLGCEA